MIATGGKLLLGAAFSMNIPDVMQMGKSNAMGICICRLWLPITIIILAEYFQCHGHLKLLGGLDDVMTQLDVIQALLNLFAQCLFPSSQSKDLGLGLLLFVLHIYVHDCNCDCIALELAKGML